jgi:ribosome-associated heat shock protein Hsp15
MTATPERLRLDKWLWAARFYKTRALAAEAIGRGRVVVDGQAAKPARELRLGDLVAIDQGGQRREVLVLRLSAMRGPAPVAQGLYEETAPSIAARARAAEQRRLAPEPAASSTQGRPTKRDRRELGQARTQWQRWSASLDDAE